MRRATCCRSDLPAPPIYAKVNPADAPVLTLGITSAVMPLTKVEDLADTRIAQKISQLPASASSASAAGSGRPCASAPIPQALAAYGLNIDDLAHDDRQRQRQHAQRQLRRADPRLYDQLQTTSCAPADEYKEHRRRL